MAKAIVLFKSGEYNMYSEKKLIQLLEHRCSQIELIMVPVKHSEMPTYIPTKPSRLLLFAKAEVQFITTVYSVDLEDQESVDPVLVPSDTMKTKSLFEFINILNYGYRVRGYSLWTCECEEVFPAARANFIMIDGVSIKLTNSNHDVIYEEKRIINFQDRIGMILDDVSMACIIHSVNEMLDDLDIMEDFIYRIQKERAKRNRYWLYIRLKGNQWSKKNSFRSDYLYLFALERFNTYTLLQGGFAESLQRCNSCTVVLTSLVADKDFQEQTYHYPWLSTEMSDFLVNAVINDPYSIQYTEQYVMYMDCAEDILEMIIFREVFLEYIRYVLDVAIFEMRESDETLKSFIVFSNPESLDPRRPDYGWGIIRYGEESFAKNLFKEILRMCGNE